ncbi:PREDICTED: enzymatic polyprotein-like [Fragaria vesca subsp. vesca]
MLKPVISEDPQLYWERDLVYCQLRMHDANTICHVKAIPHYREEDRKEMESQIQELLEKKLIRPSNSPHHAPAFLVRNHAEQLRGKARMVIDYRDVNKKTVKDGYQIAQVRVLINRLKGAKIFSKFDAKSGFWQVKMHPDSIALRAFGTPQGHYEWLVMPCGLKQAPSIFQRKMDNIFRPYSDFCIVYIDDILVFSKTMNEHLKHFEQVCKLIVQKGIILGQKKIHLIKGEIDFLGIHVKDGEIRLQDHIVKKISQFPDNIPDAKSLQR